MENLSEETFEHVAQQRRQRWRRDESQHVYYIGSSKQANGIVEVTKFMSNYLGKPTHVERHCSGSRIEETTGFFAIHAKSVDVYG